jgi:hypothetical protein
MCKNSQETFEKEPLRENLSYPLSKKETPTKQHPGKPETPTKQHPGKPKTLLNYNNLNCVIVTASKKTD